MKRPILLVFALALYVALATTMVRDVGVVGEVAAPWSLEAPPRVVTAWSQGEPVLADREDGVLRASQVRPLSRVQIGPVALPLAVNSYTGGPPDWPARALFAATGSLGAVTGLHVVLGGLLLVLVHRFLRFHGSPGSGGVAVLVLATAWSFLFYRKVLGGTEVLLQAAALLVLWSFWSRRWAGGRLGSPAIAVGVGLGFLAKITFGVTLVAFAIAALATRWDKPALKPPPPLPLWKMGGIVVLLVSPLLIASIDALPALPTHDYLGLQLERAADGVARLFSGGSTPARETASSLRWFLFEPLAWFGAAYGAEQPAAYVPLRLIGWLIALGGSALAWWDRRPDRADALLRFASIFVPTQILLLWLANRDLHHMAQATPMVAIWFALACNRLLRLRFNPKSLGRAVVGVGLAGPWVVAGVLELRATDEVLADLPVEHFTEHGQAELVDWLDDRGPLWACDYDLYGMLETRGVAVTHVWADHAQRYRQDVLADLPTGELYLWVEPSAPMIYNCERPDDLELIDTLGDWAALYRLEGR